MAETGNLALPLLAAGQAQKHVTVNEALTRLDVLCLLAVKSRAVSAPPGGAAEGDRHVVPAGATGDWAGMGGRIAVRVNGGWDFIAAKSGWRAWVEDEAIEIVFASGAWAPLVAPVAGGGVLEVLSFEHQIVAGADNLTGGMIPAGSVVFAVTARVVEAIDGPASWSLGVDEAETRYGAGIGAGLNAFVSGAVTAPLAYAQATPLKLSAEGAAFSGAAGRVAINIHHLVPTAPDPV